MSHLAFWWLKLASARSLGQVRFLLWPRLDLQLLHNKPCARGVVASGNERGDFDTPSLHSLPSLQQQPSCLGCRLSQETLPWGLAGFPHRNLGIGTKNSSCPYQVHPSGTDQSLCLSLGCCGTVTPKLYPFQNLPKQSCLPPLLPSGREAALAGPGMDGNVLTRWAGHQHL